MSPHEIQQLIVTSVMSLIALCTLIPLGAVLVRRLNGPKQAQPPALASGDAQRIIRMEAAIDAISLEVERIAESQRFMTKLMSDTSSQKAGTYLPSEKDRSDR